MKRFVRQQLTAFLKGSTAWIAKGNSQFDSGEEENEDKEDNEEGDSSISAAKCSKYFDSFDSVWTEELLWLISQKYNEVPKRMVWTVIPCKLFRKDKLREHEKMSATQEFCRSCTKDWRNQCLLERASITTETSSESSI